MASISWEWGKAKERAKERAKAKAREKAKAKVASEAREETKGPRPSTILGIEVILSHHLQLHPRSPGRKFQLPTF